MDLTTAERVRVLIMAGAQATGTALLSDTSAGLGQLITEVSAAAESYLDRNAESGVSRTEYFDVERGNTIFRLRAYPVASVTNIWLDYDQAFGTSTLLTTDDYFNPVLDTRGLLVMKYPSFFRGYGDRWSRALKVTYTGGMAATAAAFITAFPDIAAAVEHQVIFRWKRRNDLGHLSVAGDAGTVTVAGVEWIAESIAVLDRYRRHS